MELEGNSEDGHTENKWKGKDRNKTTSGSKTGQKINELPDSTIFHVSLKCLKSEEPVGYKWRHLLFSKNQIKVILAEKVKRDIVFNLTYYTPVAV